MSDVFAPFTLPLRREGDAAIVDADGKTVLVIDPDRDLEDNQATAIADHTFACAVLLTPKEAPAATGAGEWVTGDQLHEIMASFAHRADVSEIAAKINAAIALRAQPQAREAAQPVPFMYAYQCIDSERWQAYRHQLKRADGSVCPGLALYTTPPSQPLAEGADAEKLRLDISPNDLAIVERVFLPANPNKLRSAHPDTIKAAHAFKRATAKALAALQQEGRR